MSEVFISNLPPSITVTGSVERRLLAEYGSMFVAQRVSVPTKIVFKDASDVSGFQSRLSVSTEIIGGFQIELQSAAMDALGEAIAEAVKTGLSITPRDADSARRSYDETVGLWSSRVEPALDHWVGVGRLDKAEAERIRSLAPFEQVPAVLELEVQGIYFAKDLSKSILYSVAPPGASQHLSLLAFDIKEHNDPDVREILARYQWFQTVVSDLPHFTYLGIPEEDLDRQGLKSVDNAGRTFWVPDL